MKESDILRKQYEDSLFSLLMKRHAEIEGEALLRQTQELNEDESAAVPEEIAESGRRVIRKTLAEKNRRSAGKHFGKFFLRFAIAAIITVSLIGAALGASASLRRSAMNLLMKMDPQMASWLVDREENDGKIHIIATWEPPGYDMTADQSDEFWAELIYENGTGGSIYVFAGHMMNSISEANPQKNNSSLIVLNGHSAVFIEKQDGCSLSWVDEVNELYINIDATQMLREDIITFSEGLVFSS